MSQETFRTDRLLKYIRLQALPTLNFTVNFVARRVITSDHQRTENASIVSVTLGECATSGEWR